jgi:hypothetical protein
MQCFHCRRAVFSTTHRPKGYQVDYYRLHTGYTEVDYLVNPKPDAPPLRYLRLTHPIDVFTCVDCYARPDIRRLLDDDISGRHLLIDTAGQEEKFEAFTAKG